MQGLRALRVTVGPGPLPRRAGSDTQAGDRARVAPRAVRGPPRRRPVDVPGADGRRPSGYDRASHRLGDAAQRSCNVNAIFRAV